MLSILGQLQKIVPWFQPWQMSIAYFLILCASKCLIIQEMFWFSK